jgi:neutral amino acid transport system permease protein
VLEDLGNGIVLGSIIAVTSLGLSLVFGVTRLINFAHGELVTLGAVIALVVASSAGDDPPGPGLPLVVAALAAVAAGAGLGLALERGLFRPLRRRVGGLALLVITFGLALVLRHLTLIWIGPNVHQLPLDAQRQQELLFVELTPRDALVVLVSLAVMVAVGLFLLRSGTGRSMRALSENSELARASGIDVDRVVLLTWALGGALAAAGGILFALTSQVTWNMGTGMFLFMLAAVILGGIGTAFGAMAGGLGLGIVTELAAGSALLEGQADAKVIVALVLMVGALLIRPQGLLGRAERVS